MTHSNNTTPAAITTARPVVVCIHASALVDAPASTATVLLRVVATYGVGLAVGCACTTRRARYMVEPTSSGEASVMPVTNKSS
jgi:hypothetical protein